MLLAAAAAAEVVLNVTAPQQRAKWVHGHMVRRYYSANTLYMYVKCVYLRHCWWLRSYSVGDRWMNDYEVLVKRYWRGKTEILGEKSILGHLVHHKSHKVRGQLLGEWALVWPDISQGLSRCGWSRTQDY